MEIFCYVWSDGRSHATRKDNEKSIIITQKAGSGKRLFRENPMRKNHAEEERKTTVIWEVQELQRFSVPRSVLSSVLDFLDSGRRRSCRRRSKRRSSLSLEERDYICSIRPICMRADNIDVILTTAWFVRAGCCNNCDDGRLIFGLHAEKFVSVYNCPGRRRWHIMHVKEN